MFQERRTLGRATRSVEAWSLTGRPVPNCSRSQTPVSRRPWPASSAPARLNEDFRDFLAALIAADARFLVVGAHALDLADLEAPGEAPH